MQLYIMRHGISEEPEDWDGPDATRPLTKKGVRRTRKILEKLLADGKLKPQAIYASPYVRAQQTAQIASEVLAKPVTTVDVLACGARLKNVQRELSHLKAPESVMLVGHEPDCGEIIAELAGDPSGNYALKKAGIAFLEGRFAARGMKLKWRLAPHDVLEDE